MKWKSPEKEISIDDARQIKKSYKVGDEVLTEMMTRALSVVLRLRMRGRLL